MKNTIIYCLATLSVLSLKAGEQKKYVGRTEINIHELAQRGDSLYVSMTLDLLGASVDSRESMTFTPVLSAGERQAVLPEISIKGKNNYRVYERSVALMSRKERSRYRADMSGRVFAADANGLGKIEYNKSLPYESWMADASLDMRQDISGCRGIARLVDMRRLADNISLETVVVLEAYVPVPYVVFVTPEVEQVKRRDESVSANLDFKVGTAIIRPDFGHNRVELAKIGYMIEQVKNDPNITVRSIEIIGYASPEGNPAANIALSEKRATELGWFITSRYGFSPDMYKLYYGGVNWEGLKKRVEVSELADKQQVLDIIASQPESQRQAMLMNLGATYKMLLEEAYPSLREAVCKVNYDVRALNVEEAKMVIKERPQDLSLNEMFMVANSYGVQSPEFAGIFETAARLYPNDPTALLNAAASALSRRDVVLGKMYLDRAGALADMPEYKNNVGVLYMLVGQPDDAQRYLEQAQKAGVAEAALNMQEVEKKRESDNAIARTKNR